LLAGTSSFAADTPATSSTTPPAVDKPVSPQDGEAAGGPRADRRAERFEQRGREMFEKTDTNKDGFISKDEMIASHKARIDDMFEKMDTNKDGMISHNELLYQMENKSGGSQMDKALVNMIFSQMDKTPDGQISEEEFIQAWMSAERSII